MSSASTKIITTRVTLEIRPSTRDFKLNIVQAHRDIFMALNIIEPTVKCFNPSNITINFLDEFSLIALYYTSMFNEVTKHPQNSRVYKITFKI